MKKKNSLLKLFLLSLTAGMILVPALASCSNDSADKNTDLSGTKKDTAIESTPADDESITFGSDGKIYLVRNGQSEFQIIRSDFAKNNITKAAMLVRSTIENATGASIELNTDWDEKDIKNFEILIGQTTRAESEEVLASLKKKGYYVGVKTTEDSVRIVITGEDDTRIEHAVDHFLAKCVVADENGNIVIDPDFEINDTLILTSAGEDGAQLLSSIRAKKISDKKIESEDTVLKSVTNIHSIGAITGQYSVNRTRTNYMVGGTDLGVMVEHNDKMYIFFGDTMSGEKQDNDWRSNVCAVTTDYDYTNGILFDTMLQPHEKSNFAKEIVVGQKVNHVEMTKIPTGAISIGDTIYLSFMSVNNWEAPEGWECNYGGIAKSSDEGKTWTIIKDLQWPGDSMFCQMFPIYNEKDGMIYVYGITGGRRNIARLMRVAPEDYENFDAYEYLVGRNDDGSPIFEKGEEAMMNKFAILPGQNGELSIMYSEYLDEWICVRLVNSLEIAISTAKEPWGPFTPATTILTQSDIPGLYGGFMHPIYTSEDGSKVAMIISVWLPAYNSIVVEMTLNK